MFSITNSNLGWSFLTEEQVDQMMKKKGALGPANPRADWPSITLLCKAQTMNGFIVLLRDDLGTSTMSKEIRIHFSYPLRIVDSGTFFTPRITIRLPKTYRTHWDLSSLYRLYKRYEETIFEMVSVSHQYEVTTEVKQQPALEMVLKT